MEYQDYYETLGVARNAAQDEIKRAYRKLARKYHPDVSKETNAEDKFKALNEAYEVLKDPEKRAAYDQLGANWQNGQEFRPPPDWDTNFEFSGGGFTQADASVFSEFFEQMFGGHSGFRQQDQTTYRGPAQDHHAKIAIDLEDSIHGASRSLTLQTPYVNPQGQVRTKPHVLNVKIPKGICAGQQIRLKGQGAEGLNGAKGDLYLEVSFNPHRLYRINGRELELDVPIAPWEAALGATVKVPTPEGAVNLKVPPGASTDQRLRLRGRGIPGSGVNDSGNLTAILKIVTPPAGTDAVKTLYEQMQRDIPFNPREALGV
ncbi:MAG: cytochrome C biogenesis protein [Oleiphilus sp.]|nr:MAG: cytochrome C biogenesis protein [Oleiphilus sp.]